MSWRLNIAANWSNVRKFPQKDFFHKCIITHKQSFQVQFKKNFHEIPVWLSTSTAPFKLFRGRKNNFWQKQTVCWSFKDYLKIASQASASKSVNSLRSASYTITTIVKISGGLNAHLLFISSKPSWPDLDL